MAVRPLFQWGMARKRIGLTDTTDVLRGLKAGRSALEKVLGAYPIAGLERAQAERAIREIDALADHISGRKDILTNPQHSTGL